MTLEKRCKVCNSLTCKYMIESDETEFVLLEPTPEPEPEPEPVNVCEICGAIDCTIGEEPEAVVCDICLKENCPYFSTGSF